ncbi:hypothetical protein OnM2_017090 [Erysiphe neolycopersici]|uniref:Uncharacterized protein n=1 Tax=Erysiphe neolycopersici TaxID=212602 RepID=A0A420I4L7_9PEZI|nr:hypothetical protein OnM2_017090 [Erysiphe neolycopersici]
MKDITENKYREANEQKRQFREKGSAAPSHQARKQCKVKTTHEEIKNWLKPKFPAYSAFYHSYLLGGRLKEGDYHN